MTTTTHLIDEVLLDALKTPQHRVFLFALEVQLSAFLQDRLDLAAHETNRLNAFQRLLAHKLGDYYQLGHASDVPRGLIVYTRTPDSVVPARSLLDLWQDAQRAVAEASGVSLAQQPKMRIMKRSEGHSAPVTPRQASPAPSSSQSKDLEAKEKEVRYALARARIFKDFEPDSAASSGPGAGAVAAAAAAGARASNGTPESGGKTAQRTFKPRQAAVPDPDYSRTLFQPNWQQSSVNAAQFSPSTAQGAVQAPVFDTGPTFMDDPLQNRHAQYQGFNPSSLSHDRMTEALARGVPAFQMPERASGALPAPRSPMAGNGGGHRGAGGNIWQYKSTIPLSSANLAALEASTQAEAPSLKHLWLQPPRPE